MTSEPGTRTLPLVEEEVRIEARPVVTGKVRISTSLDTVEEIARTTLEESRVEVTRVPIGREIEAVPEVRQEGDVTVIPLFEEVMVLEKKLFLREELHVRRLVSRDTVEVPVTLRKQRAVVERASAGPGSREDEESKR